MLETTKQDTKPPKRVESSVWTERMLAALVNGVKGGKWFSLMDKIYAERTLQITAIKLRIFNFKSTVFSIAYDNSTKR